MLCFGVAQMGGVSIRAGTRGPHRPLRDENSSLQPACKVWPYRPHLLCHDSYQSSPWCNLNGWLGIKHQVTYLHTNLFDEISHWIVLHFHLIPSGLICTPIFLMRYLTELSFTFTWYPLVLFAHQSFWWDISLNCPSLSLDTLWSYLHTNLFDETSHWIVLHFHLIPSGLFHFVVSWIKLAEHTIFRRRTD